MCQVCSQAQTHCWNHSLLFWCSCLHREASFQPAIGQKWCVWIYALLTTCDNSSMQSYVSRVPNQNGVSQVWHSRDTPFWSKTRERERERENKNIYIYMCLIILSESITNNNVYLITAVYVCAGAHMCTLKKKQELNSLFKNRNHKPL